jgi:hypothetical protein
MHKFYLAVDQSLRVKTLIQTNQKGPYEHMAPLTRIGALSEPAQLCRKKARECLRSALTSTDPTVRLRYLQLAKLWREMGGEAVKQAKESSYCKEREVVLFLNEFKKSRANHSLKPDNVIVAYPEKSRL